MLSAVGTHLGPGRAYNHPFAGPTVVPPTYLPSNSLNSLPPNLNLSGGGGGGMSATEFARPHPKPRYNGGPINRNSSNGGNGSGGNGNNSTSINSGGNSLKFSEQNSPVNLAVTNSQIPSPHSPKDERLAAVIEQQQKQQQQNSELANSLFQSRMPQYGGNPTVVTNTYRDIDYSAIYGRSSMYAASNIYSAHAAAMASRQSMHHRNAFLSSQIDPYPPYLTSYNPPSTLGVLVPSQIPIDSNSVISSVSSSSAPSSVSQNGVGGGGGSGGGNGHGSNGIISSKSSLNLLQESNLSHRAALVAAQQQHHHSNQLMAAAAAAAAVTVTSPGSSNSLLSQSIGGSRHNSCGTNSSNRAGDKLLEKELKERSLSLSSTVAASSNDLPSNCKNVGFKVPSGKEGSLKHRILVRPFGEKDGGGRRKSPNAVDKVTLPTTNNNIPTNFTKGQLVEIAHGELKRIEDLRTEDFLNASEKTSNLKMIETTVVKITLNQNSNNVAVTLCYGNHRKKVDMEVNPEHPFFVYGQGWASYNPQASLHEYGLECQKLRVGDICISLYTSNSQIHQQISPPVSVPPITSLPALSQPPQQQQHQHQQSSPPITTTNYYPYSSYYQRDDKLLSQLPQNLSRRSTTMSLSSSTTIPTTATGTAVTSRPISHIEQTFLHMTPSSTTTMSSSSSSSMSTLSPGSGIGGGPPPHHLMSRSNSISDERQQQQQQRNLYDQQQQYNATVAATAELRVNSSSSSISSISSSSSSTLSNSNLLANPIHNNIKNNQQRPSSNDGTTESAVSMVLQKNLTDDSSSFDGSNASNSSSRKRRWSAPDSVCDEDEIQQEAVENEKKISKIN